MLEARESIIAGRYRLLRRLRRGGMSEVFLSIDEQTQQQVALKLVSSDSLDCFKRLKREIRVLSKLSHKHILPILDYGEWREYAYLVMPYMKHGTLREQLAQSPLAQETAGNILSQVANALQYAHEQGVLHRDIKASNVLLDSVEDDTVYLADFGLAKVPGEGSDVTQTGCLIGTPEYMAPELVTMPESRSSDLYALGILLYQMLTGQLPFTGTSPIAICWKHIEEAPPLPSSLNPTIPPAVEAVILRAIDKDPARRFPDPRSLAAEYEWALHSSEQTSALSISPPLPPVQITVSRLAQHPTQSIAFTRQAFHPRAMSTCRKGLLTLVALLWLLTSISLGFIVGRAGSQAGAIASVNVHNIGKAVQPVSPTRVDPPAHPTPPPPPTAAPTHPLVTSQVTSHENPPPPPPHKHHKHKHGDGGGGDGGGNGGGDGGGDN